MNLSRDQFFNYPKSMEDEDVPDFTREQFRKVHELYGSNDIDAVTPHGAVPGSVPWPRAPRRKNQRDVDPDVLRRAIEGPTELRDIDPRQIHATQPQVTRGGIEYYMSDEYERIGETFADRGNAGNRFPTVYSREGVNVLLSGHHRSTAALLQGRTFPGRWMEGPWGPERGR